MIRILTLLATCLLLLPAQPAHAETRRCTAIESLPAVIGAQGVYCLKKDLSTSISTGEAIDIRANNVTLDCNHWKIGGLGGGPDTTAIGIRVVSRKGVTIRNCGIRGFQYGIHVTGSAAVYQLLEDNRIDLSTTCGILISGGGRWTVRRNRIYDSGGNGHACGIWMRGPGEVIDNTVQAVISTGVQNTSQGIYVNSLSGSSFVLRNRVVDVHGDGTVDSIILHGDVIAARNTISRQPGDQPTPTNLGINCVGHVIARDNLIMGFQLVVDPYRDCISTGNVAL
jgi:hypothetical protein